jgi:hypothetical protein
VKRRAERFNALRRHNVGLVDNDDVGFFKLLLVHVEHLRREAAPGFEAEHAGGAHRVHHHAERGHREVFAVQTPKRI